MKLRSLTLYFFTLVLLFFSSCKEDELGPTIFPDLEEEVDKNNHAYAFNQWLHDNYLLPYNLDFKYRMEDVGADMNYNLVPTKLNQAIDMALLVKYLWFDSYSVAVNGDFLKLHGPRIIHLIGSPAYNPSSGTMILGLAEGGIKVTLFRCNVLNVADVDDLNEFYFKTMHHEFAHILHQTIMYPKEFNLISSAHYEPFSWQERPEEISLSLGFVSSYGSSQTREDFVEIIANYIVHNDEQWANFLDVASRGWELQADGTVKEVADDDGVDGKAVILQKLNICKLWLKNSWNLDLDVLRDEVQYRQNNINMEELRKQLDQYTVQK